MQIKIKTNGYELTRRTFDVMQAWEKYVKEHESVKEIEYFFWSDHLVMVTVTFNAGGYGHFNIYEKAVHLVGYKCSMQMLEFLQTATLNDEGYNGQIKL